jgi:hypothetical protein
MANGAAGLTVWHPQLRSPTGENKSVVTIGGGAQAHKIKVALR